MNPELHVGRHRNSLQESRLYGLNSIWSRTGGCVPNNAAGPACAADKPLSVSKRTQTFTVPSPPSDWIRLALLERPPCASRGWFPFGSRVQRRELLLPSPSQVEG